MLQSPIREAFSKLENPNRNNLSGKPLDALESIFQSSRSFSDGFEAFTQELLQLAFWQSQDYPANPYKDLCLGLAAEIDGYYCSTGHVEPTYHSRKHFQDVCIAMTALLDQSDHLKLVSDSPWAISRDEAWTLLFCAIAHDVGHNGSINQMPFELEKASIEKIRSFLNQSTTNQDLQKQLLAIVEPIILATDPSFFGVLINKFINPIGNPTKTDCLSMLMVEADLLASTLPNYGEMLGQLLGQEWGSSNPKGAAIVASNKGRLQFLENICFISPHAIMLGMESIRHHSIELLEE